MESVMVGICHAWLQVYMDEACYGRNWLQVHMVMDACSYECRCLVVIGASSYRGRLGSVAEPLRM